MEAGKLPRWTCQVCKHPFAIAGADSYAERISGMGSGSVLGTKMDNSFVVLPKQKNPGYPPPRPRVGGGHNPAPGAPSQPPAAPIDGDSHGGKTMDGSFVVLPLAAASMYRNDASGDVQTSGAAVHPASHATFSANVSVLTKVFEIATAQTQVEQPLCLECMRKLSEELDKQLEEVNRDIKAYGPAIERLEKEKDERSALTDEEFSMEKQRMEEEERNLEAIIKQKLKESEQLKMEVHDYERKSKELDDLEDRYWHDFNNYKLQLIAHQEERDAALAKIDVAEAQLESLKKTNVLNEAFYISHDGEFGTINNFRLGRLPHIAVEWDEINAAWGQACLLLHTMAQHCQLTFTYRLMPMGSYACVADNKNTYELYGPVNLFWSTHFDKAMIYFLACLREFAEFANAKDRAAKIPRDKCFTLPYKIENDKVDGLSITQSFNRPEKWTRALKHTLCNLKWELYWLIGNSSSVSSSFGV